MFAALKKCFIFSEYLQLNSIPYTQPLRAFELLSFIDFAGIEFALRILIAFIDCVTEPIVKIQFVIVLLLQKYCPQYHFMKLKKYSKYYMQKIAYNIENERCLVYNNYN